MFEPSEDFEEVLIKHNSLFNTEGEGSYEGYEENKRDSNQSETMSRKFSSLYQSTNNEEINFPSIVFNQAADEEPLDIFQSKKPQLQFTRSVNP